MELDDDEETPTSLPEIERGAIQSIERASAVLALLDQDTRTLTPALVAGRLGLNRTTAHRYLQSLQGAGFLDAGYGLGPLFDQLAALISGRQQILSLAPGIMRELSDAAESTCVLSMLGRGGAVVTLVEEALRGTIILTVKVGTNLEVRAAQSRALLAFQSDPDVVARAHAGLAPAEIARESQELARVRRERVAWGDLGRIGLSSVAAPVFGAHDIQAAIALLGTSAMLPSGESRTEKVQLLRDAADRLSDLLTP
ncbi:IclR family transcriptional regulator [Microbacterium sp. 1.5R]|uniref:IclR family transcriptional regulator n=1 Tax=Microbacterium sp. 1.5R TaxID=1916917 RepID=UPI00119DD657|nr:helix-turn-helix domain-containing protein [Microbacterium sp. 1.5R]